MPKKTKSKYVAIMERLRLVQERLKMLSQHERAHWDRRYKELRTQMKVPEALDTIEKEIEECL